MMFDRRLQNRSTMNFGQSDRRRSAGGGRGYRFAAWCGVTSNCFAWAVTKFAILIDRDWPSQSLAQPVVTEVGESRLPAHRISASVGYACYPEDASSRDAWWRRLTRPCIGEIPAGKELLANLCGRGRHRS